jgi:hypothetical protein
MGAQEENRLSELSRRINEIDKQITKAVAQGDNTYESEKEFRELRDEVKQILGDSLPIDHRDPHVRKILQRVRNGNYFYVDKKDRDLLNRLRNLPPEALQEIDRILGVEDGNNSESYMKLFQKFIEEIHGFVITPDDYFERKKDFSTIIVASLLPPKFLDYYQEIRLCFLFGFLYAAVGLCRVLIEISFRDKYNKLGFSKKKESPNVYDMDDYRVKEMIKAVCTRTELKLLKSEAIELYGKASAILHGRESTIQLNNKDVLQFIRNIFTLIETLYA